MANEKQAPGQQKSHTLKRTTQEGATEERQVTQEEWRTQGAQLRADGWVRDDGGDVEAEGELPSGTGPGSTGGA